MFAVAIGADRCALQTFRHSLSVNASKILVADLLVARSTCLRHIPMTDRRFGVLWRKNFMGSVAIGAGRSSGIARCHGLSVNAFLIGCDRAGKRHSVS